MNKFYGLSALAILGVLSFMLTFAHSIITMKLPIKVRNLPYNCSSTNVLLAKEILKVILIVFD